MKTNIKFSTTKGYEIGFASEASIIPGTGEFVKINGRKYKVEYIIHDFTGEVNCINSQDITVVLLEL